MGTNPNKSQQMKKPFFPAMHAGKNARADMRRVRDTLEQAQPFRLLMGC